MSLGVLIAGEDIPKPHTLYRIVYKNEEIRKFNVLFFHRLMRKNFGDPSEIEYDRTKLATILPEGCSYSVGIEDGRLAFRQNANIPINQSDLESALKGTELREWKYYVRTKHNDIILIRSERHHSELSIYHVLPQHIKEPNHKSKEEGESFIESLLREANRQLDGGQLFDPRAEFEKGDDIKHYILHNVFLENYLTAKLLLQASLDGEQDIKEGVLKFDAADPEVRASIEKMGHIDQHIAVVGAYYLSSILYFFMAFEGFVNLIHHAFLKDAFRTEISTIDRRLDLEQKLLFMPALCDGFNGELVNSKEFIDSFKQLKNFRNAMIHAKISDSLISASFIEQGFFYSIPIAKQKEDAFPGHKIYLDAESVISFAKKAESLMERIKNMMDAEHREVVNTYFMKELRIAFWKKEDKLRLTRVHN